MAYSVHNFINGNILTATELNQMDIQISANEQALTQAAAFNDFQPAMSDAAIIESEKNPFAWNDFDKGYVSFVFDDLRDTVDSPCSIFEEYGFPIVLAAIPARENSVATGLSQSRGNFTPGMTMKNICLQVVANGGEIMAHNPRAINEELQWSREFMHGYFVDTKKALESWGLTIRGIIRAGGIDQLSFSPEIDRWLFSNYEYSNMSERFANHNIQRITINQAISDLKSAISTAAANHTWVRVMAHDYEYGNGTTFTGESDLREILDYCKTVGVSVVTYGYMFDRFGTSELAKNRDISLTPITPSETTNDQYYNAVTGEHYTGSATGSWSKYTVVPGKTYYVTGSAPYSGAAYPCCAFFDGTDLYRLAAYGDTADASITDLEVTAPANAQFMVLNTTNRYTRPVSAKVEVNLAGKVDLIESDLGTAMDDIDDLREDLDQLAIDRNTARVAVDYKTRITGSLISCIDGSTAGTDRAGWEYRLYDVEPGKAYYVSGRAASAGAIYPCCAFLAEGSAYRLAAYGVEADTAYSAMRVVAPNNAATMLVNTSSTDIQPIAVKVELDLGEQVVYMNTSIESLQSDTQELQDDMGDAQTELTALKTAIEQKAPVIIESASGSIATFPDGADGMPIKSLAIALEPIQTGEGDPSPQNVRPITGHSGVVTIGRSRINIWDEQWENGTYNNNGTKPSSTDTSYIRCKNPISVHPGATYYIKLPTRTSKVIYLDKNLTAISNSGSIGNETFTTPAGCSWIVFHTKVSTYANDISINYPSTDTDYHPGTVATYPITLPTGTFYGGTLDPVKGTLIVDRGIETYDGDEDWRTGSSDTYYTPLPSVYKIAQTPLCNWLTSLDPGSSTYLSSWQVRYNGQITNLMCKPDSSVSTLDGWKAYLAEHPLTVCYRLAVPLDPIPLDPVTIGTLLGYNAIWSDSGAVEVEYPADTKTYIDNRINASRRLIAGIETGFTASKAYSVGDMLIIGDDLYKVASSIASGATITVGTNVTKTTVVEQLLALANA